MPLILLNNCLLTFLYISFKSHLKINIFIVFAYTAVLAVGFASKQRSSKAGRVVFFLHNLHQTWIQLLQCVCT